MSDVDRGSTEHRNQVVDYLSKLVQGKAEGPVDVQALRDVMQFWAADAAIFLDVKRKLLIAEGALDALGVSVDYETGKITPHAQIDPGASIVLPEDLVRKR